MSKKKGNGVSCLVNAIVALDDVQRSFEVDGGTLDLIYTLKERLLAQIEVKHGC